MWRIRNWLKNKLFKAFNPKNLSSSQTQIVKLSGEDLKAHEQFLIEILQATSNSNGDAEVVYPLLAANIDKLDDTFAERLRSWATSYFEKVEANSTDATNEAEYIAVNIFKFGNLIQWFSLGNKANNMEIAVASYETVLKFCTQEDFPQDWATIQNHLGDAYCDRIKGNKAENIENAIQFYQAALKVRTQEAFPTDWATTQNDLGTAYYERIKGDKAENIENAIQ